MIKSSGSGWDVPAAVRDKSEFHWFHLPVKGSLMLCVLSDEPIWYVGHYHRGRMKPCTKGICALCAQGVGGQLRYVVSVVEILTRRIGLLEVGQSPALVLRQGAAGRGGLRGSMIEVFRSGRSKHCRFEITILDEPPPGWALVMKPVDVKRALQDTWERIEQKSHTTKEA